MTSNFLDLFATQVSMHPQKTAIIFNDEEVTYKELDESSSKLAFSLLNLKVKREEIIPLLYERCPEMIIAMLAILKAGCAFLPISPYTLSARISYLLEDCHARFILTHQPGLVPSNCEVKVINAESSKQEGHAFNSLPQISSDSLAYIMYTSGSTGKPKGVLIEHGSMLNLFDSLVNELDLSSEEKILALTDYTFDVSLIELLLPLFIGSTLVLTSQGTIADGSKIKSLLKQYSITLMQATPITWELLLRNGWKNDGVLKVLVGGEKFSSKLADLLEYQYANIWNLYGPTETTMWSMIYRLGPEISADSVSLGKPLQNTSVYLLNKDLNFVKRGSEGEIFIGGQGLARGYLNAPMLTAEKFIIHPITQEKLYKTGDTGIYLEDNNIYFLGRSDDQIKFGGIRIEAGEIESIIEQEEFVQKAVVKVHEQKGYYKALAAYVEIKEHIFERKHSDKSEKIVTDQIKSLYDEVYKNAATYQSQDINLCGWKSAFTGKNFEAEELKESFSFIAETIRNSNLSDVLEIGSGTGEFITQFIDDYNCYTAVELSQNALNYIDSRLSAHQKTKIKLKNCQILDLEENEKYSCIILNSVIQYFPSVTYLVNSLKKLINLTQDEGTIIIGDVRSLELFEVYLLERMKRKRENSSTLSSFYYKNRDLELIASPLFFEALSKLFPEISCVDISVKHNSYDNELTHFRYDVVLSIKKKIQRIKPLILNYSEIFSFQQLNKILENNKNIPVIVRLLPNIRIQNMLSELKQLYPREMSSLVINNNYHVDYLPEEVESFLKINISTHSRLIQYDNENAVKFFEVHYYPLQSDNNCLIRPTVDKEYTDLYSYCRNPYNLWLQHAYLDHIKSHVSTHLPACVRPSAYIWMEKWPVTINGKLDKKVLELPPSNTANKLEGGILEELKGIWAGITGENACENKNIFHQGISSLYAHLFLATINETFGISISYPELLHYNTLIDISNRIEDLKEERVTA